jgi:hypothetical protein
MYVPGLSYLGRSNKETSGAACRFEKLPVLNLRTCSRDIPFEFAIGWSALVHRGHEFHPYRAPRSRRRA